MKLINIARLTLIGTKKDVISCSSLLNDVKAMFAKILDDREKEKNGDDLNYSKENITQDDGSTKNETTDLFVSKGKRGSFSILKLKKKWMKCWKKGSGD